MESKQLRWSLSIAVFTMFSSILAGCASVGTGVSQYEAGDYAGAFSTFETCAQEGDPDCIGSLGVMYLDGTAPGGKNRDLGLDYIELAARYGIPEAQQMLIQQGRRVPPADLQASYEARQAAEQAAMENAAYQLGCAVGGGCSSSQPSYAPPASPQPSYSQPSFQPKQSVAEVTDAECSTDFQCGTGQRCVRPEGSYRRGMCVTAVNEYGIRDYKVSPGAVGVHDVTGCRFDTDCPVLFRCQRRGGELKGLCMKR